MEPCSPEARQFVLEQAKANNVRFIKLWFTDILGYLKSFSITMEELEASMIEGRGFDGSSIDGFVRIDESDMIALPDPSTFVVLPWRSDDERGGVGRMYCDIYQPSGEPFHSDPRYVLKRQLARAAELGFTFYVGPELEYFYFPNAHTPEALDTGGYFDMTANDSAQDLRRDTIMALEAMGVGVEYSHHEVAPSQHEIDLRYTDALTMADACMTYRITVKEVAMRHGLYATFMPKPIFGENGSGMHTHQSLFKGERNAFYDANDPRFLSQECYAYIAGLLKHGPEITLVTNQWINSYKRLVPGYEAPVYLSWALRNRSDLIRVPQYAPGKEKATRIEYRAPDPACNPYLAFAAMLAAGLEGIEQGYECPAPTESNVYKMVEKERKRRKIGTLPPDLLSAIELAENSKVLRKALGDEMHEKFIENKKAEWDQYRMQVTDYEIKRYLPVL
ncbi:MAG: glutamine synthetase family protein [Armatimonadetes bacterium]|nr:glutamine synthetase family protein [Armatimonadota bacterium]